MLPKLIYGLGWVTFFGLIIIAGFSLGKLGVL